MVVSVAALHGSPFLNGCGRHTAHERPNRDFPDDLGGLVVACLICGDSMCPCGGGGVVRSGGRSSGFSTARPVRGFASFPYGICVNPIGFLGIPPIVTGRSHIFVCPFLSHPCPRRLSFPSGSRTGREDSALPEPPSPPTLGGGLAAGLIRGGERGPQSGPDPSHSDTCLRAGVVDGVGTTARLSQHCQVTAWLGSGKRRARATAFAVWEGWLPRGGVFDSPWAWWRCNSGD